MQLQLSFTVFLLKILSNLLVFGNCYFSNYRNILPIFVFTLREKGRSNKIILRFRCYLPVFSQAFFLGVKTEGLLNSLSSMLQNILVLTFKKSLCQMTGQIVLYLLIWVTSSKLFLVRVVRVFIAVVRILIDVYMMSVWFPVWLMGVIT